MSRLPVSVMMMTTTLLFVAVSCGGRTDAEPSDSTPSSSFESTIAASMQGAQLEVWGGGVPAPGGTTSMFVHRGNRAAEVYWTTNGWCVARLFTWSLEHVVSATRFDIRYVADRKFERCVQGAADDLVLQVYDESQSNGVSVQLGAYPALESTWVTRARCSVGASATAPCGFTAAAAAAAPWI